MSNWKVERDALRGILSLRLEGQLTDAQIEAFAKEHDAAIDLFHGKPYRVFCDIRGMRPLSPVGAETFERAKRYSAAHKNFRGSAVLVDSQVIALQHQRTSLSSGVASTELISPDDKACWAHLEKIAHSDRPPSRA